MCCDKVKQLLGGSNSCYQKSTVAKSTGNRKFELVARSANAKAYTFCRIDIDCLNILTEAERCDHVIVCCDGEDQHFHFVEFKDSNSSRKSISQIEATIAHFREKDVSLKHNQVYAYTIFTGGVSGNLKIRMQQFKIDFLKKYGTEPVYKSKGTLSINL